MKYNIPKEFLLTVAQYIFLIVLIPLVIAAQTNNVPIYEDDEVIEIESQSVRVPILIESVGKDAQLVFAAKAGSVKAKIQSIKSAKNSPLKCIVINLDNRSSKKMLNRFKKLNKIDNLLTPVWITANNKSDLSGSKNSGWEIKNVSNLSRAISLAEVIFSKSNTSRQSLLIINGDDLAVGKTIWKRLNPELPNMSRAVTVISPRKPKKKRKGETYRFYQSNMFGRSYSSFSPDDYTQIQIKTWIKNMNSLYIVEFPLPDGVDTKSGFKAEVSVANGKNSQLAFQSRFISVPDESAELTAAVKFLDESTYSDILSSGKIYRLEEKPGESHIYPAIRNILVTSGVHLDKLNRVSKRVMSELKLPDNLTYVLFDHKHPTIFTYKLRSISLSTSLIHKLSDDELASILGHEIGHLYFAKELLKARKSEDSFSARVIELKCDVIALLITKKLGIEAEAFERAIDTLVGLRKEMNLTISNDHSPSLNDRRTLVEKFNRRTSFNYNKIISFNEDPKEAGM